MKVSLLLIMLVLFTVASADHECKDKKPSTWCERFVKTNGTCYHKKERKMAKIMKKCKLTCGVCKKHEDDKEEEEDSGVDKLFQEGILKRHNEVRAMHSAQAMVWSEKAATFAQSWCDMLAKNKQMKHSDWEVCNIIKDRRHNFCFLIFY